MHVNHFNQIHLKALSARNVECTIFVNPDVGHGLRGIITGQFLFVCYRCFLKLGLDRSEGGTG